MEHKELEVYSEAPNFAIVRVPGRKFPGCVVQGDSLFILLRCAEDLHRRATVTGDGELVEATAELVGLLGERFDHYEAVLKAHGLGLPYVRSGQA